MPYPLVISLQPSPLPTTYCKMWVAPHVTFRQPFLLNLGAPTCFPIPSVSFYPNSYPSFFLSYSYLLVSLFLQTSLPKYTDLLKSPSSLHHNWPQVLIYLCKVFSKCYWQQHSPVWLNKEMNYLFSSPGEKDRDRKTHGIEADPTLTCCFPA